MSRIESGKLEIAEIPMNISETVKNICQMSQILANTKKIEFTSKTGEINNPYVLQMSFTLTKSS